MLTADAQLDIRTYLASLISGHLNQLAYTCLLYTSFCRWQFAVDNQAIQVSFADEFSFLFTPQIIGEVVKRHPIFSAMCL